MTKNKRQKQEQKNTSKKHYPIPPNWYGDSGTQQVRRKLDKQGYVKGKKLS